MSAAKKLPNMGGRPDNFSTPGWALDPILPYLSPHWRVWEPATGKGNLVEVLLNVVEDVYASDILPEERVLGGEMRYCRDFLTGPPLNVNAVITNPPFSLKEEFLARCYELRKPFALLMPLTALEGKKRQALYRQHGLELVLMHKRINFETPNGSTDGNGSSAYFASAWFTWGLGFGKQLTFCEPPAAATREQTMLFEDVAA